VATLPFIFTIFFPTFWQRALSLLHGRVKNLTLPVVTAAGSFRRARAMLFRAIVSAASTNRFLGGEADGSRAFAVPTAFKIAVPTAEGSRAILMRFSRGAGEGDCGLFATLTR